MSSPSPRSPVMPGGDVFSSDPVLSTPIKGKQISGTPISGSHFRSGNSTRASNSPLPSPTATVRSSSSNHSLRPTPPVRRIGSSPSNITSLGIVPLSSAIHSSSISIKADPTIITAFDVTDKELYELWAPKQ